MKAEYRKGPEVAEKFEEAMTLLFRTPNPEVDRKEKRAPEAITSRKAKKDQSVR